MPTSQQQGRPKPMTTCQFCRKSVRLVMKQDPDMPQGVKIGVPAAHKCIDGPRKW